MEIKLFWKIEEEYLRSKEIEISDNVSIRYVIHNSSPRSDFTENSYAVLREVVVQNPCIKTVIGDGYLDKTGFIICGSGTFCATGLPKTAKFASLEKAIQMCEDDADDIKNDIVRNFKKYTELYGVSAQKGE